VPAQEGVKRGFVMLGDKPTKKLVIAQIFRALVFDQAAKSFAR
jgi:hypothetical protein